MNSYSKNDAIHIVVSCARQYKKNLSGRQMLFILLDQHDKTSALEVSFEKRHYLHLTGLKVKRSISASQFFDRCIDGRLSPNDFEFAEDGTTQLKLTVLPSIVKSNLSASLVGDYNGESPRLYTEKLIGGVRACVGFTWAGNIGLVPNTLLSADIRDISRMTYRIAATYRKYREEEQYQECVRLAKDIDWGSITLPTDYDYLADSLPFHNESAVVL